MSEASAQLVLEFATEAQAEHVERALRTDDDPFARTRRDGRRVHLDFGAPSPASLRRAIDDALACAAVAEDIVGGLQKQEDRTPHGPPDSQLR